MAQYFAFDCATGDAGDVTCVAACSVKPIVAAAVGTSILLFNDQVSGPPFLHRRTLAATPHCSRLCRGHEHPHQRLFVRIDV